jgi:alkylhydroperoxidase/carboxymuconolactone decarboxylase family protein YurZ
MTQARVGFQQLIDEHAPDLAAVEGNARNSITGEGALSSKVKMLMMMICDALLNHESGVTNLANRARGLGASEAEIKEALGVAFLMGGLPAGRWLKCLPQYPERLTLTPCRVRAQPPLLSHSNWAAFTVASLPGVSQDLEYESQDEDSENHW